MPKSKKSTATRKKTRRESYQHPALEKGVNLKSRQEEIDDIKSYWDQLSPAEKEWMNKFTEEYVHANIGNKPLHKTSEQKKSCYNRNNARNRDVYTREKAQNKLVYREKLEDFEEKE